MTSFSPEPEFWVEDAADDGSGRDWDDESWDDGASGGGDDGAPPGGPPPPPGPRRWVRWAALVAGLAVIAALIAWQNRTGTDPEVTEQTTSWTPPAPTPLTEHAPSESGASTVPIAQPESTALVAGHDPCASPATCQAGVVVEGINPIPSFLAADPLALPGAPFELIGLQGDGDFGSVTALLRYRSDTGAMVRTEVSSAIAGPLSLVSLPGAVYVKPWAGLAGGGFVIPDGERAIRATGDLNNNGPAVPAADGRHVWVPSVDYRGTVSFVLADPVSGKAAGEVIDLPAGVGDTDVSALQGVLTGDGAGYLLVRTIGGVYDVQPGETQLVTHGTVLATGPTGYLVYECDKAAACSAVVADRATGDHTALVGYAPASDSVIGGLGGVISPDGRYAALIDEATNNGPPLGIVDLRAQTARPVGLPIAPPDNGDVTSMMAFTPDSACLIVISGDYVRAVDPATGNVLGELPVPAGLRMITVRAVG